MPADLDVSGNLEDIRPSWRVQDEGGKEDEEPEHPAFVFFQVYKSKATMCVCVCACLLCVVCDCF